MPEYQRDSLVCDFCSSSDPTWVFPVDDFTQAASNTEIHLHGAWNACDICATLVDSADRGALVDRSMLLVEAELDSPLYLRIRDRVTRLHEEFFVMRSGDAVRDCDYDGDDLPPGRVTIEVVDATFKPIQ